MMALAGQCDDARTRADRKLGCEHANAAAGTGDHDRFTSSRSDGAHGSEPGHAGDEQCARHLPRNHGRLRRQVGRLDHDVLGVACAVVRIADHLVAHGHALHGRADLLDHAGKVRTLAARKRQREEIANAARTHCPLAGIDAGGADRDEHLVRAGLRPFHLAHVEDFDAAVIVDLDCLHDF